MRRIDKYKGKCTTCRFNNGKYDNCTAGTYYAEQGLNKICYEGELWEANDAITEKLQNAFLYRVMVRFSFWINRMLHPPCLKCRWGRVRHNRSEWTGRTWIEVYKCDRCNYELI